jgi:hypothetical protein
MLEIDKCCGQVKSLVNFIVSSIRYLKLGITAFKFMKIW